MFRKIHKNTPKKRFRHRCFLVNSAKFLIKSFLRNPSDGCFCINTPSVYCRTMTFSKKRHKTFVAQNFFYLICKLATRVSSIFQSLSQKSIFHPVEHLRWSFFREDINRLKPLSIFAKKGNFRFQLKVYDGCHVILMMSINLNDIAILNICDVDHCCIITGISKTEALNLLQNTDISKKVNIIKHENLL